MTARSIRHSGRVNVISSTKILFERLRKRTCVTLSVSGEWRFNVRPVSSSLSSPVFKTRSDFQMRRVKVLLYHVYITCWHPDVIRGTLCVTCAHPHSR